VQVPFWQLSVCVQALPSLHPVPFVAFVGAEHCPVDELQVPATWHAAAAGQVTGLLPVQAPLWQLSVCVQALPSSQLVPFVALVGVEQVPVEGLHVPATLHAGAVQLTGFAPVQAPLWQVSVWVQALPSLQLVPFATARQVAVAAEQAMHVPHAAPAFCHVPFASHVCGCEPLQVFAPGVQLPVQVPLAAVHTYWHAAPVLCQVPVASQVCG